MSTGKKVLSGKDITTIAAAALALSLVVLVFIRMYTGSKDLDNEADATTVHVYSEVNEEGEIVFYTMIENYTDSGLHASVRYPTKTTEPKSAEEEETSEEETTIVYVTDENGEKVTDKDGNQVTKVEVVTPPSTVVEVITGEDGHVVTNAQGKPVTVTATVPADGETKTATEEATQDIWSEVTTTQNGIKSDYVSKSDTANTVISEINKEREANGLSALSSDSSLGKAARAYSTEKAMGNSVSGKPAYYFVNEAGGASIYNTILQNTDAESGDYTKIGVGIIKYDGNYYTTVYLS